MKHALMIDQIRIFYALVQRDMHVLKKNLRSKMIDASILTITNVVIFGKLFPLIGVPSRFIAPLFLGSGLIMMLGHFGYGFAIRIVYDVQFIRFINYHMTIPISKFWLFLSYIVSFVIETLIITIPLVTVGILLLRDAFITMSGSWFIFLGVYLLCLSLIATLFLSASFYYDFEWFRDNLWARRLFPLFLLSTVSITWKELVVLLPRMSLFIQLNPLTLFAESLRSSLLGGSEFLPLGFCVIGLVMWTIVFIWAFKIGVTKRLDPV